MWFIMAVRVNF